MKKYIITLSLLISSLVVSGQDRGVSFYNQGTVYVGGDPQTTTALYINGSYQAEASAVVSQSGKTILTGDFVNNVTSGNVYSSTRSGSLEFRGSGAQYIRGTADKSTNYIHFPQTLIINNQNTGIDSVAVVIDPLMGVTTTNLTLTRGRLVLDSKAKTTGGVDDRQSDIAHLLVEDGGSISYNRIPLNNYEQGIIQIKLAMGDEYQGRLIGFTPPFKNIYADYFMFNFLSHPTNAGLFGDKYMLITNPQTPMIAGTGYIVGQEIVPATDDYYTEDLDPVFVLAAFGDRATDMYSFGRSFAPQSLSQFVNPNTTLTDRYDGEELCIEDVTVTLEQGFNYVGNPYTVPLDMSGFVTATASADAWGVSRAANGSGDVRNSYYVMSQGTGSYHPENNFARFKFNVSYLLGQLTGSTISYDGGTPSHLIAPMQMFIVGCDLPNGKQMTIPADARSHGNARFLRSSEEVNTVTDEIMIETKDNKLGGYDRLCVVFREDATTLSNDPYDAGKIFNESGGVSQIYTRSSDAKDMTTNVVSPQTESLVMYFRPADQPQEVTLGAYRLQSLASVKQVVLEDTKTNTKTDLINTPGYSFMSSPTDAHDRFILHFSTRAGEGIDDESISSDNISIYYNSGMITIQGMKEENIGSQVSVYSMNGQQVYSDKIDEVPSDQHHVDLPQGTYVVKVTGEKAVVSKKLLVK